MASRARTSITLLTVFLIGMVTPAGTCALTCLRHQLEESQRHCAQPSEFLAPVTHHHSAMNHHDLARVESALVSSSCRMSCGTGERLAMPRKVFWQVTSVENGAVVFDPANKFGAPDPAISWFLHGTPPDPCLAHVASFSVLRI
jgi:hypothetical protein